MKKLLLPVLMLFAFAGNAQTPLMENFSYSTGQLTSLNTGANVSGGNWVNFSGTATPLMVTSTGLSYSGYVNSGIGGKVDLVAISTSAEDAYRACGSTIYTTGSVFTCFMINLTDTVRLLDNTSATGDYFMSFLPSSSTTALNDRFSIKKGASGNTFNIGIRTSSGMASTIWASTDYSVNTTYLIAIKHVFISGTSNDSTYLWVNPSTSGTIPTPTISTCQSGTASDLTDISRFALRQGTNTPNVSVDGIRVGNSWTNTIMPVNLISFKGIYVGDNVQINWATASETNNKGFEVQRSLNGTDFNSIGFVNGAGNSNKMRSYQFIDENSGAPVVYYRLNQIDQDGKSEYSEIIALKNEGLDIHITPNPFADQITINSSNAGTVINAEVIDLDGKVKMTSNSIGNLNIDTRSLAQGIYFIRVNNGEDLIIKRIIKN